MDVGVIVHHVIARELVSSDGVADEPQELATGFDREMREHVGRVISDVSA